MVRPISFRNVAAWRPDWRQGGKLVVIAVDRASDHESLQQWFSNCGS